jgi:hypothetical protein
LLSLVNPFELPGRWYRANLHTHTTLSDGQATPAQRVKQYARAGYDILALTDHRTTQDVASLAPEGMLIVSGMEFHPSSPIPNVDYHLVALNVPHGLHLDEKTLTDANRCIDQVRSAGGIVILAHPFWCGMGFEDFRELKGLSAMEVYNATCDRHGGRPSSENEWAHAMDRGMTLPIVGVDDAHSRRGSDVAACWTWLRAASPTAENVAEAIRTGACYASQGPKIHHFGVRGGALVVRSSPVEKIQFIGGPTSGLTRQAPSGRSIVRFSAEMPTWPYARVVVTDASGRKAWTNPLAL